MNIPEEYSSLTNPFSDEFSNNATDIITIPINQIGRMVQSTLFLAISAPDFKNHSPYKNIFNHIKSSKEVVWLSGSASTEQCKKIIIQTKNIGGMKMTNGILIIWSVKHPCYIQTSRLCETASEINCHSCSEYWSDNEDIEEREVSSCPYDKCLLHIENDENFSDEEIDGEFSFD